MSVSYHVGFDGGGCTQSELEKLRQAAQVHGYRGPSKKKHDGIVPLPGRDSNLWTVLERLSVTLNDEDRKKYVDNGTAIKVVAHVPSGWRLIGYRSDLDHSILLLGAANYDRKLNR